MAKKFIIKDDDGKEFEVTEETVDEQPEVVEEPAKPEVKDDESLTPEEIVALKALAAHSADIIKLLSVEAEEHAEDTDEEIAEELGLAKEELTEWQSQLKITNVVSLNEFLEQGQEPVMDARGNSHFSQPEDVVAKTELKKVLEDALDILTEKEKKVILLYYYEDLTLKEISKVLEVSESRVSQLHTKALLKMRGKMGKYMDILVNE